MICIIKSRTAYFIKFIGAQNNKKPARRLVCLVSCVCFCHIDCTTSVKGALPFNISIGIATVNDPLTSLKDALNEADLNMYSRKQINKGELQR